MHEVKGKKIELTRGDSFIKLVTPRRKKDGTVYHPVPGDKIRFALKHADMKPGCKDFRDANPIFVRDIPISTMLLHIYPADTAGLSFGPYVYDIELTYADGRVDTFIDNAPFIITPEVY